MNWQTERKFSARAFKNLIDLWEISQAGMGRFLGRSERTIRRWVRGEIKIPAAESLLLTACSSTTRNQSFQNGSEAIHENINSGRRRNPALAQLHRQRCASRRYRPYPA